MKNKPKYNHFTIKDLDQFLLLEQDSHGWVDLRVILK